MTIIDNASAGWQDPQREASLRTVGNISYGLHAVVAVCAVLPGVQASIALLLVAFILDLVKRDAALGSWQESHFRWRIRSVVWAAILYVVTIPLWLLLIAPGWIAWAMISVWFLYRVMRGWLALHDRRPMPARYLITWEADMHVDPNCIFCKIVASQIPSRKVLEDDEMLVFRDVAPWAPVHLLMIPKEHLASLYDVEERHAPLLGRMLALAPKLMRDHGVVNGFRTLINSGADGLQEVPHLHIHVIGGPRPWAKG